MWSLQQEGINKGTAYEPKPQNSKGSHCITICYFNFKDCTVLYSITDKFWSLKL